MDVSRKNLPSGIETLSNELIMKILLFLEDTDIQTAAKLNKRFFSIARDPEFWTKFIIAKRNRSRVDSLLFGPGRRVTRRELTLRGVLKAVPRGFREGQYLGSTSYIHLLSAAERLKKSLIKISIERFLANRLDPVIIFNLFVPKVSINKISPCLLVRAIGLDIALRRVILYRKFSERPSVYQAAQDFLRKARMIPWMLCPGIRGKIKYFEEAVSKSEGFMGNSRKRAAVA